MKISKKVPTISIYAPNRTTWLGATRYPQELSFDYNFNGYSTMEFEINKYIYDEARGKWVLNPLYSAFRKRNLVYVSDNTEIYSYRTNALLEASNADVTPQTSAYRIKDDADQPSINASYAGLTYTPKFYGCALQDETLLYDVGARSGYTWSLNTRYGQEYKGARIYAPASGFAIHSTGFISIIAAEYYIPVQQGDIIAMGSKKQSNGDNYFSDNGTLMFDYLPFFYKEDIAPSCSHIGTSISKTNRHSNPLPFETYDPIKRMIVDSNVLEFGGQQSGYVRFSARVDYQAGSPVVAYRTPNYGYVKVFSGERRLKSLEVSYNKQQISHGIPWWTIAEVTEVKQGLNSKKKIIAYSYEYVLSQRCTSLSESTLPLYIPDVVVDTVQSDDFVYYRLGKITGTQGNNVVVDYTTSKGAQRMERGLMNQILDCLPGWSIQYISAGLATRYRSIPDVDNENVYSFLMNTVQKAYNCYFIFDTENLRINILSHQDFQALAEGYSTPTGSGAILSWRNVMKEAQVSDIDDSFLTCYRVYSSDDTYGLGLVNPTGSNEIYNFQSVLPLLEYSVDAGHINPSTNEPYTLRELCEMFDTEYTDELESLKSALQTASNEYAYSKTSEGYANPTSGYTYPARWNLIAAVYELPRMLSKKSDALAQFEAAVIENNTITGAPENIRVPLNPMPLVEYGNRTGEWSYESLGTGGSEWTKRSCWADWDRFVAVRDTARDYWEFKDEYDTIKSDINTYVASIKASSLRYCLDYKTLLAEYDAHSVDGSPTNDYTPIFTPIEAIEMSKYIYEGRWENENIIFSETFAPDDIVNTLIELLDIAKYELDSLYSKPQYDFEVELADMFKHSMLGKACEQIYLGSGIHMYDGDAWVKPILLGFGVSYGNGGSSKMTFSTNYERKPLEIRFSEMFATINQVSVTSPQYSYEE